MVKIEEMSTKQAEKFITERQAFYRGIISLVEGATKMVEPKNYHELNSYTVFDKVVKDFHGFDLMYHASYSDSLSIYKGGKSVLRLLYSGNTTPPHVDFAAEDRSWERSMKKLIKDPTKAVDSYKVRLEKAKVAEDKKNAKRKEGYEAKQNVLNAAKRMNLA